MRRLNLLLTEVESDVLRFALDTHADELSGRVNAGDRSAFLQMDALHRLLERLDQV